jgi:hypothetical protein
LFYAIGCVQCHQPAFAGPRTQLGQVNADFDYFKKLVYSHTTAMPEHQKLLGAPAAALRMGNFNPLHVPEQTLQEIFKYVRDEMGFRAAVRPRLSAGVPGDKGVTYTVTVTNGGVAGRGLAAEGVTVAIIVPPGNKIVTTTGAGYKGVTRAAEGNGEEATWTLAKLGATEEQTYTITFEQPAGNLRGAVRWMKPASGGMPEVANIGQAGGRGRGPGAAPATP